MLKRILLKILMIPVALVIGVFVYYVVIPYSSHKITVQPVLNDSIPAMKLSEHLLLAVKTNEESDILQKALCALHESDLERELQSSDQKKAFWLNIYNAYSQLLLEKDTTVLKNWKLRLKHYSSRKICIAGNLLSLNDIEHGMLRHSKIWWSEGYLNKWFPNKFERAMRVPLDVRIHFALNCGATSCPAIAFYSPEGLDQQLDLAVKVYLKHDIEFDSTSNTMQITELFKWYKGDFEGKKGVISFLKKYQLIPLQSFPKIIYKKYDWSVLSKNFR